MISLLHDPSVYRLLCVNNFTRWFSPARPRRFGLIIELSWPFHIEIGPCPIIPLFPDRSLLLLPSISVVTLLCLSPICRVCEQCVELMGEGCLNKEHFDDLGGILTSKFEEHFKNQELRQGPCLCKPVKRPQFDFEVLSASFELDR